MLKAEDISKSFGARSLFQQVSYHFHSGERYALVGPNGAGKTTLLNILSGLEEADEGRIITPADCRLGILPQDPNTDPAPTVTGECLNGDPVYTRLRAQMAETMASGDHDAWEKAEAAFRQHDGYSKEAGAHTILQGLGFRDPDNVHPLSLSGGWRMRLELAKIFLQDPDFLILDEPTNHLDLPSLVWVERFLTGFRGALLFVSHDRPLLNRLATVTLHLHQGRLDAWKGNFDAFLSGHSQRQEQVQREAASLARQRQHLQKFVDRFGAKATKARQAQSRVKMISRLRQLEEDLDVAPEESRIHFRLPDPPPTGREVLAIRKLTTGYDGHPLTRNIDFSIEKGQRIAVIGSNGIGKSTLLKTIAGRLPPVAGTRATGHGVSSAWFAQDQTDALDPGDTVLQAVLKQSQRAGEKEIRTLLGHFLFHGDDVSKEVAVLSGGEKSRTALACLLVREANFLMMDEPTNHLDMASCAMLVEALAAWPGTLIFVSHNRDFIDELATHVLAMSADGQWGLFEGQLDDYQRLARVRGFPDVLDPLAGGEESGAATRSGPAATSQDEARSWKRQRQSTARRIEGLEKEQEQHRQTISTLEKQLEEADPTDYARIAELDQTLRETRQALERSEEEWLEQSEKYEEAVAALEGMGRR